MKGEKGIMGEEKELFGEVGKRENGLCIQEKQKGRCWGGKQTRAWLGDEVERGCRKRQLKIS